MRGRQKRYYGGVRERRVCARRIVTSRIVVRFYATTKFRIKASAANECLAAEFPREYLGRNFCTTLPSHRAERLAQMGSTPRDVLMRK